MALLTALALMPVSPAAAQSFTILRSFDGSLYQNLTIWQILHSFAPSQTNSSGVYTNSDGEAPYAGLLLAGGRLYGTTSAGGAFGNGTVFAVSTNGSAFTTLYTFSASPTNSSGLQTNSDGASPQAGLILSGSTLYGTTTGGGEGGNGTVFALSTNGTEFTLLYSFSANNVPPYTNSDGAYPTGGLRLSGNTLFGTAPDGGSWGNGTVFSLSFRPQLNIVASGANVILTWPTNFAGFDYTGYTLQSTTTLVPPAVWTTNLPAPVVVGGQNTVTNPISGQKFFRLIGN
jgi:uncharacterized repeat protein (TIGR03803 family)